MVITVIQPGAGVAQDAMLILQLPMARACLRSAEVSSTSLKVRFFMIDSIDSCFSRVLQN